jgi:hypothetical protein
LGSLCFPAGDNHDFEYSTITIDVTDYHSGSLHVLFYQSDSFASLNNHALSCEERQRLSMQLYVGKGDHAG